MTTTPAASAPAERTLGLFAKQPRPGEVKTRLAAGSSPHWAARVADAFLRDQVDRLGHINVRRILAFSPVEAQPFFADLVGARFALVSQREGDLGRRMSSFITEQFKTGARSVVLVGTDSPTLPLTLIEQAFAELERADVVVGPATDGGYYLIGCSGRVPPIFDGILWGSNRVLADAVARLTDPARRLAVLPPWYDVDTVSDLWVLRGHLAALRRAGLDPGVPHVEQLIQELVDFTSG